MNEGEDTVSSGRLYTKRIYFVSVSSNCGWSESRWSEIYVEVYVF